MKKIILILTLLTVSAFAFFANHKLSQASKTTVTIAGHAFAVEVADDINKQTRGLSKRTSLPQSQGMLFTYDTKERLVFWMKDTLVPLDIVFINDDRIVKIYRNVKPQPNTPDNQLNRYTATEPVNYVLEINAGLSEKYGFDEDDKVIIKGLK